MRYVNGKFIDDRNMLNFHYSGISNSNIKNENIINVKYENKVTKNIEEDISVCIIIPTYNESKNILKLLKLIYSKSQQNKYDKEHIVMNVLVVDDNSPDGTSKIVNSYQKTNPNVYLLSRNEKNGLGAAYIAGMQHAMKLLKPGIIFEMDGDLSHSPKYIMSMIKEIKDGADFVIGSRYVRGGSIPENWGIKRKMISKSANLYAKTLLGISHVNDCTGGFRAIRTSKLEQVDLSSLKTKGYAFQISLLEEMRRNNSVMREVPIDFKDRTNGISKMKVADILEEGMFVLQAGFENTFYPKKQVERESWLLNQDIEHSIEFNKANGIMSVFFVI